MKRACNIGIMKNLNKDFGNICIFSDDIFSIFYIILSKNQEYIIDLKTL